MYQLEVCVPDGHCIKLSLSKMLFTFLTYFSIIFMSDIVLYVYLFRKCESLDVL
jgi:hypothetical protein